MKNCVKITHYFRSSFKLYYFTYKYQIIVKKRNIKIYFTNLSFVTL